MEQLHSFYLNVDQGNGKVKILQGILVGLVRTDGRQATSSRGIGTGEARIPLEQSLVQGNQGIVVGNGGGIDIFGGIAGPPLVATLKGGTIEFQLSRSIALRVHARTGFVDVAVNVGTVDVAPAVVLAGHSHGDADAQVVIDEGRDALGKVEAFRDILKGTGNAVFTGLGREDIAVVPVRIDAFGADAVRTAFLAVHHVAIDAVHVGDFVQGTAALVLQQDVVVVRGGIGVVQEHQAGSIVRGSGREFLRRSFRVGRLRLTGTVGHEEEGY